jgi:predicted RNA-binding Zn-ribbon protein involved in translation (DUF1610 family)
MGSVKNDHFVCNDYWKNNDWYMCPNCGFDSLDIGFNYCPSCGEELRWELE